MTPFEATIDRLDLLRFLNEADEAFLAKCKQVGLYGQPGGVGDGTTGQYTYYRCTKNQNRDCTQKTLREEALEEQILGVLGRIRIPAEFHQWAIDRLKEDHEKEKADQEAVRASHHRAIQQSDKKIASLIDLRLANEIDPETFKARKDALLAEKHRLEELHQDAGHRVETWLDYAEKALGFAETAQERFQTGDMETKRQILAFLGVNLFLKDRALSLELKPPLELIGEVAPDVRALHDSLEPRKTPTSPRGWDQIYARKDGWGG